MWRLRRYRYYALFAAVVVFLLFRVAQNSKEWETVSASSPIGGVTNKAYNVRKVSHREDDDLQQHVLNTGVQIPHLKNTAPAAGDKEEPPSTASPGDGVPEVPALDGDGANQIGMLPFIDVSDKSLSQSAEVAADALDKGTQTSGAPPSRPAVHWRKMPEHFPVAEEDVIPLPTGKPVAISTVQHKFGQESSMDRERRLARLDQVKAEMQRGWKGYMTYARGHDELVPVTKEFRDPFCGWAATLVDSLDTLWIMDMKEEFDDAILDVEKIDFTTTNRSEIPVFETTIRYLGGLIAAYDVSGGKAGGYDILLEKAVELAEILMGVFDTPNRMPILYYNWKPEFVERPQRAGTSISIAELGSLAMEFTRLAQITKENRYYDAVARITDALYEWQGRGTSIPGIFPERVDASGCNSTKLDGTKEAPKEGIRIGKAHGDEKSSKNAVKSDQQPAELDTERRAMPAGEHGLGKRSNAELPDVRNISAMKHPLQEEHLHPLMPDGLTLPECVPKGLDRRRSPIEEYHMGGSQDSAYEYFPKQWLLLGGLEPKYEELHLMTVEAVKKWLLYRPMVPDERDILFSAKVTTHGKPDEDASPLYEATHLTCFLGGMFGLGGRIFSRPGDVEIGARLTDGCVWAYEQTPTGIMPEAARVVPCDDPHSSSCRWNQTRYEEWIDPSFATRDADFEAWLRQDAENKAREAEKAREEEQRLLRELVEEQVAKSGVASSNPGRQESLGDTNLNEPPLEGSKDGATTGQADGGSSEREAATRIYKKRAPTSNPGAQQYSERIPAYQPGSSRKLMGPGPGRPGEPRSEKLRPQSHREFVDDKIEKEMLPKGFVRVTAKGYILRPEAIESVWYMYRITGDAGWRDKGWDMFTAIVGQTATRAGSTAIDSVLELRPDKSNSMESFWTAETLKYFYLLYSDPDLISLDEWVLNTEAHPFRRPTAPFGA
ncbi:glycoside hydrolase family 47 protein [Xylariaceae sp. FL0804]|nr:glycoside hydrolase family 47 protein [Xylariaceae sp. FL0804]